MLSMSISIIAHSPPFGPGKCTAARKMGAIGEAPFLVGGSRSADHFETRSVVGLRHFDPRIELILDFIDMRDDQDQTVVE